MLPWALLLTAGLSAAGASHYALQPAGTFHGGEPVARDGEPWLALRRRTDQRESGTAALVATRLRVRPVHDAILDRDDQTTGREVSSALGDALMFLRGGSLKAGPVATARFTPSESQPLALPQYAIDFGGRPYRISTICTPSPDTTAEQQAFDCQLLFEHNGSTQHLFTVDGYAPTGSNEVLLGNEGNAHLIFAGDLDRDGKLDLIFDASNHYNVSAPTLFLSSQAAPGELVHQMARYESFGC